MTAITDRGKPDIIHDARRAWSAQAVHDIFALVCDGTGHDFSEYKLTPLVQQLEHNAHLVGVADLETYAKHLTAHPEQIYGLFRNLLVGVTSFFRDPEAWDELLPELVQLLRDKPSDYVVRAWVPGCATGEEAYSLAILLREALDALDSACGVQIFATDVDGTAVETARLGTYTTAITNNVSSARLRRFFANENGYYRVKSEIRNTVIFAQTDIIADLPFVKLDLVSCRNVLIYFDAKLQEELAPIFHYSLKPGGLLFLGASESVSDTDQLFVASNKAWKIFRRREVGRPSLVGIASTPTGAQRNNVSRRYALGRPSDSRRPRLAAAYQELQAAHEGLQSAYEELETSHEEMQSLNEELHAANILLKSKIDELARVSDDTKNLLNATDIAIVIVDRELQIRSYTEHTKNVIGILPSDVGRPIGDLVSTLRYDKLSSDAREVLRTLRPKLAQLRNEGGARYMLRIMPYRTTQGLVDGLIMTFVDVTAVTTVQETQHQLFAALEQTPVALFGQDSTLHYTWTSDRVFGRRGAPQAATADEPARLACIAIDVTAT